MKDLTLDKIYKKGSKGKKVKLIQEWLCLQGIHIQIVRYSCRECKGKRHFPEGI